MIHIDKIAEEKHSFPTVDFKFQNSGDATAFLWQFAICVLRAEVDRTPVLDFSAGVRAGALEVKVANHGWGSAQDCNLRLHEPTLDRLFPENVLRYTGTVGSGASELTVRLTKALASPEVWELVQNSCETAPEGANESSERFRIRLFPSLGQKSPDGVALTRPEMHWDCKDEGDGKRHKGKTEVPLRGQWSPILLTSTGFGEVHGHPEHGCKADSDITYIAMLDPLKGSHERVYPMSRKIPSGDIERFHIMIGSTMSCRLQVKFRFYIDKTSVIESEEFHIHIWNPRKSFKNYDYKDGSELPRELQRMQEKAKAGWGGARSNRNFEHIRRQYDQYPFADSERGPSS